MSDNDITVALVGCGGVTRRYRKAYASLDGVRVLTAIDVNAEEARAAARRLISRLDDVTGEQIRRRSLDTTSAGTRRQNELRESADDDGYTEPNLWTGIGRARSGAGAAIVGDPDQVLAKLKAYQDLGMDAFILSGYPHLEEAYWFGEGVLPVLRARGAVASPAIVHDRTRVAAST